VGDVRGRSGLAGVPGARPEADIQGRTFIKDMQYFLNPIPIVHDRSLNNAISI
jgi:hypothetical protein